MTMRSRRWIFVFFIGVMFFSFKPVFATNMTTPNFNEAMFSQAEPPSRPIQSLSKQIKSVSQTVSSSQQTQSVRQQTESSSQKTRLLSQTESSVQQTMSQQTESSNQQMIRQQAESSSQQTPSVSQQAESSSQQTEPLSEQIPNKPLANGKLIKGIYISQTTAEDTKYFTYLVERAKKVRINTFIVDLELPSKKYAQNMQLLKENNIHYVARIIVFPGGGTKEQVASLAIREKKLKLAKMAISYGASQIQLDYIRYNTKQIPSHKNSETIAQLIAWFKDNINVPLQVDVFGISSYGESKYIGQSIQLIGQTADVLCPMVYPSHYEPYKIHAVTPYETVYGSLKAIHGQFNNQALPFKLVPYIELSNYRYKLSHAKKMDYIYSQIQAVENANADGWYVWSARNMYDNLFYILETKQVR